MKDTAFDTTISYYDNIFHKTDPIDVKFSDMFVDIKHGNGCKYLIEKIRASADKKEQANLKKKLGCIMFNGTFGERKDDGLIKHSGLLVADFDNYPDAETMQAERERLKADKHTALLFTSPSGKGLKVVIRIKPTDKAGHIAVFKKYQAYIKSKYFDVSSKNVSRVCYMSHDPDIYLMQGCEVFQPTPDIAKRKIKIAVFAEKIATMRDEKWAKFNGYAIAAGGYAATNSLDVSEFEAVEELVAASNSNSLVLDYVKAEKQIRGGFEYGKASPLEVNTYRFDPTVKPVTTEFPLDVFPPILQDYINIHNDALNHSKEFMACGLMFAVSTIIGNKIKAHHIWTDSPVFWFIGVGAAGSSKTFPIKTMVDELTKFDSQDFKKFKMENEAYFEWSALPPKEKKEAGYKKKPILTMRMIEDTTIEGLVEAHSNNPNGLGYYRDEIAGLFGSFNQYKGGGKGTDESFFNQSFQNGRYAVTRKTTAPIEIENVFISIIGTIQPEILKTIVAAAKDSGLADRFLYTSELKTAFKYSNKVKISDDHKQVYSNFLGQLIYLSETIDETAVLEYSDECSDLLLNEINKYQDMKNLDTTEASFKGYLSKLITYVGRFSLLLAIIDWAFEGEHLPTIRPKNIKDAKRITDHFLETGRGLFDSSEISRSADEMFRRAGAITKKEKALVLVEAGWSDSKLICEKSGLANGTFRNIFKKTDDGYKVK